MTWFDLLSKPAPVPYGTRIELIDMPNDPCPIPSGSRGTVIAPSNGAQLNVRWDNGRSLFLLPDVDRYVIIDDFDTMMRGGAT